MYDVRKRIEELTMGEQETETMLILAREVREAAKKCVDCEEIPAHSGMPPEIIKHVLAGDTVYVEQVIIAAVVATRKAIANAIEAEIKID